VHRTSVFVRPAAYTGAEIVQSAVVPYNNRAVNIQNLSDSDSHDGITFALSGRFVHRFLSMFIFGLYFSPKLMQCPKHSGVSLRGHDRKKLS
jgi:hypothetical protein